MTTQSTQTTEAQSAKKPGFIAKVRHGRGKEATYERVGVAWQNEDGSFYIKLAGTQVISEFSLYRIENTESQVA